MQDRVSLYPGRVKLTPVSGQANVYDMVRADQPTQEGTPLNKATLLSDETAALLGLGSDAVPNDAFAKLSLGTNNYAYRVTLTNYTGTPVSGVTIRGIKTIAGDNCITDQDGYTFGVASGSSVNLSAASPFFDSTSASKTVSPSGIYTEVELVFGKKEFETPEYTATTSQNIRFSDGISDFDVCSIGAGSNAVYASYANAYMSVSGGGGGISNEFGIENASDVISIQVGAPGENAGDTVVSIQGRKPIIGDGAKGFIISYPLIPARSSNGGDGISSGTDKYGNGENGNDRSAYPFDDPSIPCSGGGGMSGNWTTSTTPNKGGNGGDSGGGKGGDTANYSSARSFMNGGDGLHYGSGGGAPGLGYGAVTGTSGKGKQGAAMFRWRYKE